MTTGRILSVLLLCSLSAYAEKSCCKKSVKKESVKKKHTKKESRASVHELKDEADYRKRITEKKHVIVEFFSSDCPACQKMCPVFEGAAKKHKDILFLSAFLDNGTFDDLADSLDIQKIPTIVFIKDGVVVKTEVGYYKESSFEELIQNFVKEAPKKAEVKKEAPKQEAKKAEPKAEAKKPAVKPEPKVEPKKEEKKEVAPAHAGIVEIKTMEEYKKHIGANKKAVIKFSTDWCGACTMYAPDFKAVGEQFKDKAGFFMINGDNAALKEIKDAHVKEGYPTTIFLIDGKVVDTKVGAYPRKVLESFVLEFTRK